MDKYRIIVESSVSQFESAVNNAVDLGWEPVGGVAVIILPGSGTRVYHQAMIRSKELQWKDN